MKNLSFAVFALALTAMPAFANNRLKHAGFEINPVNDVVYEAVSEGAHGGGLHSGAPPDCLLKLC